MRRVISLILVVVFGIPSLFGAGLHALMPHGGGDASHVHSLSHGLCPGTFPKNAGESFCDVTHKHNEFSTENVPCSQRDSDESGINWQKCRGFTCHGDDCVICLFCMSCKTPIVLAASGVTNFFVVRLSASLELWLEQIRIYTPCGRGPPLLA
ncbi:MAG: hypothetical protein PHQ75_00225 [Thermoguttaceae bacterium]|nr:hypothetical protein [Thermoguttaceae bacterium]